MSITRREFVAASASAAALAAAPAAFARGDDTLRVGLIGCGGRGTGAAEDCLRASPGMRLVALADLLPERLKGCRDNLTNPSREGGALPVKLDDEHCFTGFDAYARLVALKEVDLVLLATPPGFRPIHLAAAIEAGKHVFAEKPVAVDPAGIRTVLEAGAKAKEKNLAVVAGTQRRHERRYLETMKRLHDGALGEIVAARCGWNQGRLWHVDRRKEWSDVEWQCRNWLYFSWLSGDHIVEQHVHNIDVMNWALRAHPVRATAVGGRIARVEPRFGHIYDHFCVDFEYPNGVHVTSTCRQIDGCDGWVGEEITGSLGSANPAGSIDGPNAWRFKGDSPNPYVEEHRDMVASIRDGKPLNETQAVAESTMAAILGREAAYSGKTLSWDAMMKSSLDLSPKEYAFGELPVAPVAVPGRRA